MAAVAGILAILNALSSPAGQVAIGGSVKLVTVIFNKEGGATVIQYMDEGDASLDEAMKIATDWKAAHKKIV